MLELYNSLKLHRNIIEKREDIIWQRGAQGRQEVLAFRCERKKSKEEKRSCRLQRLKPKHHRVIGFSVLISVLPGEVGDQIRARMVTIMFPDRIQGLVVWRF